MSLWLLFVLLFILTVDIPISFEKNASFIGIVPLLKRNWFAILSVLLALIGIAITLKMDYQWKGVSNPPYEIKEIKNDNYEYLTFLTTYIIPFTFVDLSNIRYIIILIVLLVLIGFVFLETDLYYGNPMLALMRYRLYRASIEKVDAPSGVVLITKDHLSKGSYIKWIKVDEYVWIAKEIKKCPQMK